MGINMIAISAILGSGLVGVFALKPVMRDGAGTLDHASKPVRYFYRYASFGLCFLISFMVSPALFLQFLPLVDLRESPEYVQSAAALSYPLPLAIVLYWLLTKLARRASRRAEIHAFGHMKNPENSVGSARHFKGRNSVPLKQQNSLLAEMDDITAKMERGEIPLAQAEERMLALLARHKRDNEQRLEALEQESAAARRKILFALLLAAAAACAAIVFALD
jgi:hypothetical protein